MISPFAENALIVAIIGLSTALTNLLSDRRASRQSKQIRAVADVADKTHILVNSQFGEQLKINVVSAKALYGITKDPADKALLDEALRRLAEHESRQSRSDAINGGGAKGPK